MTKLLIKTFVKNGSREDYGLLVSVVGIISNIILFIVKFSIGVLSHSVSIKADAFNNFSDCASSVITIIGFKLSSAPPDKEHPFGHGRVEYITGFIISLIISMVGLEFAKSSFLKILHPESVNFNNTMLVVLIISIIIKLWLGFFIRKIANTIDSTTLKATSIDAFNDVYITISVCVSIILSKFIVFPIDGYVGLIVSIFILYSAYKLIIETLNPLIGEYPSDELVKNIKLRLVKYDNILGCHDLIIHNYGHSKIIASVHAEVPCDINIMKLHEIIDSAEQEISKELNIILVIHMDPIDLNNLESESIKEEVINIIKPISEIDSIHDFRIVGEGENKNILFDIVIHSYIVLTTDLEESIKKKIINHFRESHKNYRFTITIEKSYTSD